MKRFLQLLCALAVVSGAATAQIDSGGIVSSASFRLKQLPNSGIAQGSIFSIFSFQAKNIGPATAVLAGQVPLPLEVGGTSVEVTVGGVTKSCPLVYSSSMTVQAVLPSDVPVGTGTLKLTYNGNTYNEPITVVRANFGIFTRNQAGTGAAIVQNFEQNYALNTITQSIAPGGTAILWGTGLGPVPGGAATVCSDVTNCQPRNAGVPIEIYVGGKKVQTIYYAGRHLTSLVAVDQVNFAVPAGVTGCYVPVVAVVDGIPSNYTSISIASGGGTCSEPGVFNSEELNERLTSGQPVRIGSLTLSRASIKFSIDLPSIDFESKTDVASGAFFSYTPAQFDLASSPVEYLTIGSCLVYSYRGESAEQPDYVEPTPLDAGPNLNLTGPKGPKTVSKFGTGVYTEVLSNTSSGFPGIPGSSDEPYLEAGAYTFSGPGGADVGSFQAQKNLGTPLVWTNQDAINIVQRAQGVTVQWQGGNPADERVHIFGATSLEISPDDFIGAGFYCQEDVSKGQFTVGPEVLSAIPPSPVIEGQATGILQVGTISNPTSFTATGIDFGFLTSMVLNGKNVTFE